MLQAQACRVSGSWSFQDHIPKQELGNVQNEQKGLADTTMGDSYGGVGIQVARRYTAKSPLFNAVLGYTITD